MNIVKFESLIANDDPSVMFHMWHLKFKAREILKMVRHLYTGAWEDVHAVVLFGSAVREPKVIIEKKTSLWGLIKYEDRTLESPPNDFDVAVILKAEADCHTVANEEQFQCSQLKGDCKMPIISSRAQLHSDGYSDWWQWSTKNEQKRVHLFITRIDDFHQALEEEKSEAINIMKEGILLCGEQLSPTEYLEEAKCGLDDGSMTIYFGDNFKYYY